MPWRTPGPLGSEPMAVEAEPAATQPSAPEAAAATPVVPESAGYRVKKRLLGPPLSSDDLDHQRLGKPTALAVFASDNLSSSAYATEEILRVLFVAAGAAAFSLVVGVTVAVAPGAVVTTGACVTTGEGVVLPLLHADAASTTTTSNASGRCGMVGIALTENTPSLLVSSGSGPASLLPARASPLRTLGSRLVRLSWR